MLWKRGGGLPSCVVIRYAVQSPVTFPPTLFAPAAQLSRLAVGVTSDFLGIYKN
jgi:hypothetical protein